MAREEGSRSDQSRVSFSPQTQNAQGGSVSQPKSDHQLRKVAEGFAGISAPQFRVAPQPGSAPIVTANMGCQETSSPIRFASATMVAKPIESAPLSAESTTTESADLLDKPISFDNKAHPDSKTRRPGPSSLGSVVSVIGSLLVVVSLFFLFAFFLKKVAPGGSRLLPLDVFEDLGRTFLKQKVRLHLLRLGNRLILVSVSPDGVSPIAEISDPSEVAILLDRLRRKDSGSSAEPFQKLRGKPRQEKSNSQPFDNLDDDSDESLAEILAAGLPPKGGARG